MMMFVLELLISVMMFCFIAIVLALTIKLIILIFKGLD